MKRIKLTRNRGYYGAARQMGIYVDGQKLGNLMQTKTLELEVADDAQMLHGKMDWAKTEPFPLQSLSDGAHITVQTYFTLNPLKILGISGLPARWGEASPAYVFE
ncbi:MAG: hypothetical protein MRY64_12855 [Hyphomonadaceae bacterium]|nr:hypothetical protein [Hyphomonadaceae bacterium]